MQGVRVVRPDEFRAVVEADHERRVGAIGGRLVKLLDEVRGRAASV
jgi:hypothetical protein